MKLYDDTNSRRGLHTLILLMHIFTVAACVLFLGHIFGSRFSMVGSSMAPQIEDEEVVLINRAIYMVRDPERFEPVLFELENGNRTIKRVIGLPNETVRIVDGKFFIDGEELEDIKGLDAPEEAGLAASPIKLSVGEYFVVGDNRAESIDSRYDEVGTVTSTRITGRMFLRVYPFSRIRFF